MNAMTPHQPPAAELRTFHFPASAGEEIGIRTITFAGRTGFVTVDACRALGLGTDQHGQVETWKATRGLAGDEKWVCDPHLMGGSVRASFSPKAQRVSSSGIVW